MADSGPSSERAVILAPRGRDGSVALHLLESAQVQGVLCRDIPELASELDRGVGLAIVAEEALAGADLRPLAEFVVRQPSWSDLQFIILTQHGVGPEKNPATGRLAEVLGNVSFLERPFHPTTLVSVVRSALRSRRRQYDARARLAELDEERSALSDLTATLESRVAARSAELLTEVAARERAQAQLVQSQKVESLGQLTGGVAHDFNNLLMAVMGNLDLLRKRHGDDPRSQRLIDGAMQGARRGATLTQRMLAFARQQELKPVPTDLAELLTGMRELIERVVSSNIEVKVSVPQGLPPARVVPNQIELAILNLCINSRDAMPKGGSIILSLDQHEADGALEEGSYLRVRVVDTGVGMDEATQKKAIEPFFSTKPIGKGTGLGLSSVHGIAAQLGGRLDIVSAVGEGTSVTLWLPQASHLELESAELPAPLSASTRTATILVVDDDPLIAMSTVGMLEDLGHTVIEAHSGKRALEIIDAGREFDLIMTDQAMPGMTGTELADIVRQKRPNIPVLLATGYADLNNEEAAKLPRLSKPYLQAELQEKITRLLAAS